MILVNEKSLADFTAFLMTVKLNQSKNRNKRKQRKNPIGQCCIFWTQFVEYSRFSMYSLFAWKFDWKNVRLSTTRNWLTVDVKGILFWRLDFSHIHSTIHWYQNCNGICSDLTVWILYLRFARTYQIGYVESTMRILCCIHTCQTEREQLIHICSAVHIISTIIRILYINTASHFFMFISRTTYYTFRTHTAITRFPLSVPVCVCV